MLPSVLKTHIVYKSVSHFWSRFSKQALSNWRIVRTQQFVEGAEVKQSGKSYCIRALIAVREFPRRTAAC